MKLNHVFEFMELGDEIVAVPLDNDAKFHGVLQINSSTQKIMELLQNETTEEAVVEQLAKEYTDSEKEEISKYVQEVISGLKSASLLTD